MSNSSLNPPFFDVRMSGFPTRTAVSDVLQIITSRATLLGIETLRLDDASGRVLAADVVAAVAVPHFDRAAFDGYALCAEDTGRASGQDPIALELVGEAMPGRPFLPVVRRGQAVRIMTGSPMPEGTDAVLPAESAGESGGQVLVREAMKAGRHVGRVGEDVAVGQKVLSAGRVLRPQDLGLLSSIGASEVEVIRRPRVAILVTGDEILPAGSRPEGHRIVDSNSVVLNALVRRDGGAPLPVQQLPDRVEAIRAAMSADGWDLLLVSGGTSVGREDHAPGLVAELGELPVHGIAVRPASPAGVGFIRGRPVFLLPGNPVACLCAYDLFARVALCRLGGYPTELPYRQIELRVAATIPSVAGRVEYARVRITGQGVEPVPARGASILSSTVAADGFVLVPPERAVLESGESTRVYLYDRVPG